MEKDWPYIRRIIRVTRTRELPKAGSSPSVEVAYYVTNAKESEAKILGNVIRSNWFIENKSNYIRDVSFEEDYGIRRINPSMFAKLISFAFNIMNAAKVDNIKGEIYKQTMSFYYMLENLNKFVG